MEPPKFELIDLIQAARREVALRRRVYPRWITEGKISSENAEREIGLMSAILDNLESQSQPKLF